MSRFNAKQVANLRSWGYEPRPDEIIQEEPAPKWEPWRLAAMQPPESLSRYERMLQEQSLAAQSCRTAQELYNHYAERAARMMGKR